MAAKSAWRELFTFEIRYQLRQPLFYLVTFALSVLLFIKGTDNGASGRLHLNAPAMIIEELMKWIYFVLFLMTAFVASAAVRDFERRTSELFFSKPISRFDYLTARFAGTMVVSALPYLVGTLALAVSQMMPDVDQTRVGPFRLAPFAFALGVLILPTLIALGAAFYALASWTRSSIATYVGVVAFFAISASAGLAMSGLETQWIGELLDPFGVMALGGALRHLTVDQLNTTIPTVGGLLLWNRLLWLAIGLSAFGITVIGFDPSRSRGRSRQRADGEGDAPSPVGATARVLAGATTRVFSNRTVWLQFVRQVRREAAGVFMSLPFLGMLVLALGVLLPAANDAGNIVGMPGHPRTYLMIESLQGIFSAVLLLVVVLYSGDLIWKERALELDEVMDSMPTPSGVYLGAKLVALLLVIVAFLAAGVLALIGYQLFRGYTDLELGLYARGIAIAAVYPALMMVLACFCHVVARNKLMGYGFVLVFIVAWDLLEELGFEHHLYRFASLPQTPYSDFNGFGPFLEPFAWFSLFWGLVAVVIVGLSVALWRSGTDTEWRVRLTDARARFRGAVRAVTVVGGVGALAAGSWIFYNTNVLNAYVPSTEAADAKATYERLYGKYRGLALPRIIAVKAAVDIFPDRRRVDIRGSYQLRNRGVSALRDIHVSVPARVRVNRLTLPPHDVVLADDTLGYRIVRLRTPLGPGEIIEIGFDLSVEDKGFVNNGADFALVDNGTFFTKRDFFPVIGYDAHRQLEDADERRKRGLEPTIRMASINDSAARMSTPRAPDADRIEFETTVSTSVDQIAVTSGALEKEWIKDRRRYFHYKAELPITHHWAFASARYQVTRSEQNGVAIEIYHHPGNSTNVARMMDAARKSLAYYSTNFGPYQHRYLRIVEFPRYVRDGTAFPGMIALSESMGFNAHLNGEEAIDLPFYATAHEVAHQWWGQQLVAANVQGAGMLHESLAQYSALMVLEAEIGKARMARVLAYEREWYLRGRSGERGVEPPLALVERQEYVYYHKGALAMYALRDAVGEVRLNEALARFLARFALGGPPYSATAELLEEIRPVVPAESAHLVEDLFERVTMYDNEVVAATSTERTDGTFLVRVQVEARKRRGDSAGVEQEIPMDNWIDIAVFGEDEDTVLFLERRRIPASSVALEIVIDKAALASGVRSVQKLIDRDRGDNVRTVRSSDTGALH